MAAPRLRKIVVNMGVGEAKDNIKLLDAAVEEMALITGQRPAVRRAKKSIANFKLREGSPSGAPSLFAEPACTSFLDRLVSIGASRVRRLQGLSEKAFDGRGNYTLGITDQTIFPELSVGKIEKIKGMNITIVTTAQSDNESACAASGPGDSLPEALRTRGSDAAMASTKFFAKMKGSRPFR